MTTPVAGTSAPAAAITPSIVRTVTPVVVGALLTGLIKLGIDIDAGLATTVVTTVMTALYYAVARQLETRRNARWGWLLGLAKAPAYSEAAAPSPDAPNEVLVADVAPAEDAEDVAEDAEDVAAAAPVEALTDDSDSEPPVALSEIPSNLVTPDRAVSQPPARKATKRATPAKKSTAKKPRA